MVRALSELQSCYLLADMFSRPVPRATAGIRQGIAWDSRRNFIALILPPSIREKLNEPLDSACRMVPLVASTGA
jgi:hypothetical protein